jgi:hypothetical protein
MGREVKFMLDRFSDHQYQILYAYQTNEEFKTLCEDFYASALIVENLKKKLYSDKKSGVEYRSSLFLELENEICEFLRIKNTG